MTELQKDIQQIDQEITELRGYKDAHQIMFSIYIDSDIQDEAMLKVMSIIIYLDSKGWPSAHD